MSTSAAHAAASLDTEKLSRYLESVLPSFKGPISADSRVANDQRA